MLASFHHCLSASLDVGAMSQQGEARSGVERTKVVLSTTSAVDAFGMSRVVTRIQFEVQSKVSVVEREARPGDLAKLFEINCADRDAAVNFTSMPSLYHAPN